jgi:hypothetical protein
MRRHLRFVEMFRQGNAPRRSEIDRGISRWVDRFGPPAGQSLVKLQIHLAMCRRGHER